MSATAQTPQKEPSRARAFIARATGMEKIVYAAMWRAIARRPWKAEHAEGFPHHAQILTAMIVFVVLSAAEIVIIDLIVHRWVWVRIPCSSSASGGWSG